MDTDAGASEGAQTGAAASVGPKSMAKGSELDEAHPQSGLQGAN